MGRTGEMLIDVTDGDTIKQVQLEEQIDTLMLRINELENKNNMLTSEKLLMFVENKELKAEIESLTNDVLSYSGKLNIFCAAIACYKDELIKQKDEIATMKRKNNILKIANKFLKSRKEIIWQIEKERYDSFKVAINDIVDSENKEKPLELIEFTGYMLMVIVSFLIVFLASVVYIRFFG